MTGILYGVGVGPGDPELMTLKAARILRETKIIAYFAKQGKPGYARKIASSILNGHHEELLLNYEITTEFPVHDRRYISAVGDMYEEGAKAIAARLDNGEDVAVICTGDPFFYGSFMHLYRRLSPQYSCQVVPGITGMSGCWTSAKSPITWGDDVLTVLPATLDAESLVKRLVATDAAVIMKLGRNFAKVRVALTQSGMLDRAMYVEYGTLDKERVMPVREKMDDDAPYFSMIVIPGEGRRL